MSFDGKPKPAQMTRRGFATGSALVAMGLAGCTGLVGDSDTDEPDTDTDAETNAETGTDTDTDAETDTETGADMNTDTDTGTAEDRTMYWDRRPDAEGGRVAAMWLLIEDGTVLAELTIEDQRYRGFPDSFITFLKDNDWVYEDTWNVLGQFDAFGPAVDRATTEIEGSEAESPSSPSMSVSEPVQSPFTGDEDGPMWYRRRDFEGGKEKAVWVLFDGGSVQTMLMVESNQYTHAYGEDNSLASYVWMISPQEDLNRDEDGTLNDDPAEWNNVTPFDDPHTSMPDAIAEAMTQLEESDYPVNDGVV
jgi:hypothetical protein